jgi:hypothetical protein
MPILAELNAPKLTMNRNAPFSANKQCGYEKTIDFFRKSKGLHSYFEKNGGKLDTAIRNANHSMEEKLADGRKYTFSELGRMIAELKALL